MKSPKSRCRLHDPPRNGAISSIEVSLVRRNEYPCRPLVSARAFITQNKVTEQRYESYRHVITKSRAPEPLSGPFGGILADEMGLGKTLTTLATVLSTLERASTWIFSKPPGPSMLQRSKATVIVVPSEGKPNLKPELSAASTDCSSSHESMV